MKFMISTEKTALQPVWRQLLIRLLKCMVFTQAIALGTAQAQPITAAPDGTGTLVTVNGNQFDIGGGQQAGANLFQSFQQFGLDQGQIANFLSNPGIQTILARVVGGDPSAINGLIQVSGGSTNLYLMNPAGILFGPNASLNIPASFLATTANGIGIGTDWFNASGSNTYTNLTGSPERLAFTANQPGSIFNAGNLAVDAGQSLVLAGGVVVNTGSLTAPGGQVILAAVPGQQFITLSQPGSPLSLQVQAITPATSQPTGPGPVAVSLPALLTAGGQFGSATTTTINAQGDVILSGSGIAVPNLSGTAIIAGPSALSSSRIDVSSSTGSGGSVALVGERVGLINAGINATGATGGGTVLVGGNYQGQGPLPNALRTFVDSNSRIQADALSQGNGGQVIVWADEITAFAGSVSARGGDLAGNGGFIEISGKDSLSFTGTVDLSAPAGVRGTILFDPRDITIVPANGGANDNELNINFALPNVGILTSQGTATTDFTISTNALTGATITGNIDLRATRDIIVDNTIPTLFFNGDPPIIRFTAGRNFVALQTALVSPQSDIVISAASIQVARFNVKTLLLSATGDITVRTPGANAGTSFIGGTATIASAAGNVRIGSFSSDSPSSLLISAPTGLVELDGYVGLGQVIQPSASTISIQAARFRAINPFVQPFNSQNQLIGIGTSLYVFPANVQNGTVAPARVSLQFGNQAPLLLPADGTGPVLIQLQLLQETSFTIGRPLGPTGSGAAGVIGIAYTNIPPNLLVLLQDNQFSALPPVTPDSALTIQPTPPVLPQVDANTISTVQTLEQQRSRSAELPECNQGNGTLLDVEDGQVSASSTPPASNAVSSTRAGGSCSSN